VAESLDVVIGMRLLDVAKRHGFQFRRLAPGPDGPLGPLIPGRPPVEPEALPLTAASTPEAPGGWSGLDQGLRMRVLKRGPSQGLRPQAMSFPVAIALH